MDRLKLTLDSESPDFRSRQVSCRLLAQNLGAYPVEIDSIDLRVPTGVRIIQIGDPVALRSTPPVERLCAKLERLLATQIGMTARGDYVTSAPLWRGRGAGGVLRAVIMSPLIWVNDTWYRTRFRLSLAGADDNFQPAIAQGRQALLSGIVPEIHTLADAEWAYEEFFVPYLIAGHDTESLDAQDALIGKWSPLLQKAYASVMVQLADREGREVRVFRELSIRASDGGNLEAHQPTTQPARRVMLNPESETSKAYLLECRRGWFTARIYALTVEAIYRSTTVDVNHRIAQRNSNERTASITISPHPVSVTLIAVLGGALGTILRTPFDSAHALWSAVWSPAGLAAMILAAVFFNIFEFTSLAERFRQATSWRGALLIGLLCGLGGQKFQDTIQRLST